MQKSRVEPLNSMDLFYQLYQFIVSLLGTMQLLTKSYYTIYLVFPETMWQWEELSDTMLNLVREQEGWKQSGKTKKDFFLNAFYTAKTHFYIEIFICRNILGTIKYDRERGRVLFAEKNRTQNGTVLVIFHIY